MVSPAHTAALQLPSPFLCSPAVHEPAEAVVKGSLPDWLRGELIRTCPAVFEQGRWRAEHWFDGLGLIYAFRIGESSVSFQSRLLESDAAREITNGRARLSSFGTPTGRTLWQRLLQPVQRSTDNTNVNILKMGDDLVALTEGSRQLRIHPSTLASLGVRPYANDGLRGVLMGAHPHFDAQRQQVVNIATRFGSGGTVSVYEHGPAEAERKTLGSWKTDRVPYMHSFGLTPNHVVLVAHPYTVRPPAMLWSNRGYIDHFEWRPQEGTRLVVMDRRSGAIRVHETDALFVFHTVNAFERGSDTVLDALAYPNADIMNELRPARMAQRLPNLRPQLVRIALQPGRQRAVVGPLSDTGFEFPSTHYRRANGQAYRFVWGASDGPLPDGSASSAVVKIDLGTGQVRAFADGTRIYGEPVFVARPGGGDEDDGVLLSVGSGAQGSAMAVIDAKTMALLASVEVAQAIPLGFHGSFVRRSFNGEQA